MAISFAYKANILLGKQNRKEKKGEGDPPKKTTCKI